MKTFNPGIALLKIAACFAVVWIHYGCQIGLFQRILGLAVPSFMFIAIYLSAETIIGGSWSQLSKRLMRILLPFWFWGLICWLLPGVAGHFSAEALLTQLSLGYPSCPPLYFMPLLAVMTLLMFGVAHCCGKVYIGVFGILLTASFVVQYSGLNYGLLVPFGQETLGCVLGRFVELIPVAMCAVFVSYGSRSFKMSAECKVGVGMIALAVGCCLCCIPSVRRVPGFGYQGMVLLALSVGVCLVAIGVGDRFRNLDIPIVRFMGGAVGRNLSYALFGRLSNRRSRSSRKGRVSRLRRFYRIVGSHVSCSSCACDEGGGFMRVFLDENNQG